MSDLTISNLVSITNSYNKSIEDVIKERNKQIVDKNFTSQHDDAMVNHQLTDAAICYAADYFMRNKKICDDNNFVDSIWPWEKYNFKPSVYSRREDLVKAAALIIAEIDRLDRLNYSEDDS